MNEIQITAIDPSDKAVLKRFIALERELLKDFPLYISDIDQDVAMMLSAGWT